MNKHVAYFPVPFQKLEGLREVCIDLVLVGILGRNVEVLGQLMMVVQVPARSNRNHSFDAQIYTLI